MPLLTQPVAGYSIDERGARVGSLSGPPLSSAR